MTTISHNTELMNDWSTRMSDNNATYDQLIQSLYSLVHQFVGTEEFKGGLSTDFEENLNSLKPQFDRYSETFKESIEFINERINSIEDSENELKNRINSGNLLG